MIWKDGAMAETQKPEGEPFAPAAIPTDPDELERWKAEYTDELMAGERGGIGAAWRRDTTRG